MLLLYTATVMPFKLAFIDNEGDLWFFVDNTIDFLFMFDIYVNLNTPIDAEEEGKKIYDRCKIVGSYLRSWLLIDILASFPIGLVEYLFVGQSSIGNNNEILRLTRVPRIYRLLRMARLVKLLKMFKKSIFFQKMQDFFQFNSGMPL